MLKRCRRRRRWLGPFSLGAIAIGAMVGNSAHGSSHTWNAPGSGNWSDPANWAGGSPPVSGIDTHVKFNSASGGNYTATQDIANPLKLWILELGGAPTGSQPHTLNGQAIEFVRNPAAVDPIPSSPVLAQTFFNPTSGGWSIFNKIGRASCRERV